MAGPRPKGIRTSDLKSRVMNLAQTSSYAISLQPPRDVLNFLKTRGFTYNTDGKNVELLCSEASIPGSSLATHDQVGDYYGAREQFAYRRIYDDTFDVQFYVDRNYNTIRFFETWMDYIVGQGTTDQYKGDTAIYRMSYPKGPGGGYKSNIYMTKFEKDITGPALYYTYVGAFPKAMQKSAVSYGPSDILRVNVQFSYIRHVVDTDFSSAKSITNRQRSFESALSNETDSRIAGTTNLGLSGAGTQRELNGINAGRANDVPIVAPAFGGGGFA